MRTARIAARTSSEYRPPGPYMVSAPTASSTCRGITSAVRKRRRPSRTSSMLSPALRLATRLASISGRIPDRVPDRVRGPDAPPPNSAYYMAGRWRSGGASTQALEQLVAGQRQPAAVVGRHVGAGQVEVDAVHVGGRA